MTSTLSPAAPPPTAPPPTAPPPTAPPPTAPSPTAPSATVPPAATPSPTTPQTARPRLRPVSYEPAPGTAAALVRAVPPRPPVAAGTGGEPPGALDAIVRLLRLGCEVLDGRRPTGQLAAHSEDEVVRYWRVVAARRPVTRRSPARFRRVRLCHPRPDAAEVALAVELDGQVRALAARFDLHDGRWRWTAVRIG
ncbi:Rv3235 family protein [Pseudonocardia abyssalis]|uniref:Rv3235 family protein n=1 Tax=Pseudonocardia abyssalis TaxID=2792008 RepID=UPI001CF6BE19|nr:Rv3235 family protein [Pseudonocardia abyssalis]